MLSNIASIPHFVVTDNSLVAMVTDSGMDQEQFVSEVILLR